MNRGYIWLWRKIEDSAVFADPHLLQLFVWCLIRATHKPYSITVQTGRGNTIVTLKPGQFIFGRNTAAKSLKCPSSTIRNRIDSLRKRNMLDIHPDTHYSVITIVNWQSYQHDAAELGQATGQASGQPKDTNKNIKNIEQTHTLCASSINPGEPRGVAGKGNRSRAKATTILNPVAVKMYEWYAENIVDDPTERMEAIQMITLLLEEGHQEKHLGEAMAEYANDHRTLSTKERYRKRARTFFGKEKVYAGFPPYVGTNGGPIKESKSAAATIPTWHDQKKVEALCDELFFDSVKRFGGGGKTHQEEITTGRRLADVINRTVESGATH